MKGKVFVGNLDIRYNGTSILYQENGEFVDRNGQSVLSQGNYKKITVSNTTVYLPKPEYKHTISEEHVKKYDNIEFYTCKNTSSSETLKEEIENKIKLLTGSYEQSILYLYIPIKCTLEDGSLFEMNVLNVYRIDGINSKYWLLDEFSKQIIYVEGKDSGFADPSSTAYYVTYNDGKPTDKKDTVIKVEPQSGDIINKLYKEMYVYSFNKIYYAEDGTIQGLKPIKMIKVTNLNTYLDEIYKKLEEMKVKFGK